MHKCALAAPSAFILTSNCSLQQGKCLKCHLRQYKSANVKAMAVSSIPTTALKTRQGKNRRWIHFQGKSGEKTGAYNNYDEWRESKIKSTKVNASKLKHAFPCLTKLKCKLTLNLFVLVKIKISYNSFNVLSKKKKKDKINIWICALVSLFLCS